jgi:tellurite resistance protein TerC
MFLWLVFIVLIVFLLALDLGLLNRRAHVPSWREALLWCFLWVGLALLFNLGIWWRQGHEQALLFFTSYLVEQSLSIDNLFVFLLIFGYFQVPAQYQHKVLFWGIVGAVVMRGLFIAAGVTLIHQFHWIIYVFGAFLLFTAFRLLGGQDHQIQPEKNLVIRLARRLLPVSESFQKGRFFVRRDGRVLATPLFIVLLVVETTDIVFAVDSIPAVLAITTDPFLVYTSNIFAILGLRAFFFLLAGFLRRFAYLRYGLAAILAFVGAKMLSADFLRVPAGLALGVIAGFLAAAVLASILWPPRNHRGQET